MSRSLHPARPWPTERQASVRVFALVAFVPSLQFILNGIATLAPPWAERLVGAMWISAGVAVGVASIRIENYFRRQRRRSL